MTREVGQQDVSTSLTWYASEAAVAAASSLALGTRGPSLCMTTALAMAPMTDLQLAPTRKLDTSVRTRNFVSCSLKYSVTFFSRHDCAQVCVSMFFSTLRHHNGCQMLTEECNIMSKQSGRTKMLLPTQLTSAGMLWSVWCLCSDSSACKYDSTAGLPAAAKHTQDSLLAS